LRARDVEIGSHVLHDAVKLRVFRYYNGCIDSCIAISISNYVDVIKLCY